MDRAGPALVARLPGSVESSRRSALSLSLVTMKPWGSQGRWLHFLVLLSSGNRERLAGGPGGGNERPWSPHGGGEIWVRMPTPAHAAGMHSTMRVIGTFVVTSVVTSACFNPCSPGCSTSAPQEAAQEPPPVVFQSLFSWMQHVGALGGHQDFPRSRCFNPCSPGCSTSARGGAAPLRRGQGVSILVLLDAARRQSS